MADLEPRVRQLEEDVAILKGEIKSVLMEVRTTLLSQNNPFTAPHTAPSATPQSVFPSAPAPARAPEPQIPFFQEESKPHDTPQQNVNRNDFAQSAPVSNSQQPAAQSQPQPEQLSAPQQPMPLPVAPRRSWQLNTLAMLLAWCQGNMVRLSEKEMTSLLSLARYGGLVDEELATILLDISTSFDQGQTGRAATVSEYLLALHELHTVVQDEKEPTAGIRLLRAG